MNLLTLFLVLPALFHRSLGHLSDIIKVDTEPNYGPTMTPDQMFEFISAGVPQILWTFLKSRNNLDKLNFLSPTCKKSLTAISTGLADGKVTAYKFVDASAKTPAGFIRSTQASFGDYDQCLSIDDALDGVTLVGKYCAFDMQPHQLRGQSLRSSSFGSSNSTLYLHQVPVFKGIPFIHAICLPNQCSLIEIRQMLSTGNILLPPLALLPPSSGQLIS